MRSRLFEVVRPDELELEAESEPRAAPLVRWVPPAPIVRPSPFRTAAADELGRRVVGGVVVLVPGLLLAGVMAYAGWRMLKAWRAWRERRAAAPPLPQGAPAIGVRIIHEPVAVGRPVATPRKKRPTRARATRRTA